MSSDASADRSSEIDLGFADLANDTDDEKDTDAGAGTGDQGQTGGGGADSLDADADADTGGSDSSISASDGGGDEFDGSGSDDGEDEDEDEDDEPSDSGDEADGAADSISVDSIDELGSDEKKKTKTKRKKAKRKAVKDELMEEAAAVAKQLSAEQKKAQPAGERASSSPASGKPSDDAADGADGGPRAQPSGAPARTAGPGDVAAAAAGPDGGPARGGRGSAPKAAQATPKDRGGRGGGSGGAERRGAGDSGGDADADADKPADVPKFANEQAEADGRLNAEWLCRYVAGHVVQRATLGDITRFMAHSRANFELIATALELEYNKKKQGTELKKASLAAIRGKYHNWRQRTLVNQFDAGNRKARLKALRGKSVVLWQARGLTVPPARGADDEPLLSTADIADSDLLGDEYEQLKVDDDELAQRRRQLEADRAKAQRENEQRKIDARRGSVVERRLDELRRQVVMRRNALTPLRLGLLVPHLPRRLAERAGDKQPAQVGRGAADSDDSLLEQHVFVLFYRKGPTGADESVFFVPKDARASLFFDDSLTDALLQMRTLPPIKERMPFVCALSLAQRVLECAEAGLQKGADFSKQQAKEALERVGEAFYFNDSVAEKRRVLRRAFGWAPDDDDWLEWRTAPLWLEINKRAPSREAMRAKSRGAKRDTMFVDDRKLELPPEPAVDLAVGAEETLSHNSVRKIAKPKKAKAATADAPPAKKAKATPAKAARKADGAPPAPKKSKKTGGGGGGGGGMVGTTGGVAAKRAQARLQGKLTEAEAADQAPKVAIEARIGESLFFSAPEHVPDANFDALAREPELQALRKQLDEVAVVRTKEQAAAAFSVAPRESNTTSAQQVKKQRGASAVDADFNDDDEPLGDAARGYVRGDTRRIDAIAAEAGVPPAVLRLDMLGASDPAMEAGIRRDMPELAKLSADEAKRVIAVATELRLKARSRAQTTKKSALTVEAQRFPKAAQGQLTAVEPHSALGARAGVVGGHEAHRRGAANQDALARAAPPKAWLLREIALSALDTGALLGYADLCALRDRLREGEPFAALDRLRVLDAQSKLSDYMMYAMRARHRDGELFERNADLGDMLRQWRTIAKPGTGFCTWLARCALMAHAFAVLGALARTPDASKAQRAALNTIIDMPPNLGDDADGFNFTPLQLWSASSDELHLVAGKSGGRALPIGLADVRDAVGRIGQIV